MARDLNLLHPEAKKKALQLIQKCKEAGIDIVITQTLRTKKEQDALYAQGRTRPGKIVTNCQYPDSPHCWGVAFDIAVITNGKASWNISEYFKVGPIGESLDLEWGGRWKNFPDYPHFELPGYNIVQLRKIYGSPIKFIQTWPKESDNVEEKKVVVPYPGARIIVAGQNLQGYIIDSTVYAPVRSLASALDKQVVWDGVNKTATIK